MLTSCFRECGPNLPPPQEALACNTALVNYAGPGGPLPTRGGAVPTEAKKYVPGAAGDGRLSTNMGGCVMA